MAVRIEDAGFEIRDMIAWVYGSGFPKSLDVSKAIDRMDATEVAGVGAAIAADTVEAGLTGRSVQSVREAIRKRTQRLSQLIGDTTAKEVLAVIEASERAGLTVTETSRLVGRAVYGEEKVTTRSDAIARTESAGALSQGSWDQAKEMGDLYRSKEWLAFNDARDSHRECMRQGRIAIDQPFSNNLMYPLERPLRANRIGDPNANNSNNWARCDLHTRCSIV